MSEPRHPVPPGAYDWLLKETRAALAGEPPAPPDVAAGGGNQPTVHVEINVRARVSPTRGWAIAAVTWASIVVGLLVSIAAAQGQPTWGRGAVQPKWDRQWGELEPGRTQSYYDLKTPSGTQRCTVSRWRGEPQMECR